MFCKHGFFCFSFFYIYFLEDVLLIISFTYTIICVSFYTPCQELCFLDIFELNNNGAWLHIINQSFIEVVGKMSSGIATWKLTNPQ